MAKAPQLQAGVNKAQGRMTNLKDRFPQRCSKKLESFKKAGISVLNDMSEFLKLRPGLQKVGQELDKSINWTEKIVSNIESASTSFHSAAMHTKNIGRSLKGKKLATDAAPVGCAAKAFQAPFQKQRDLLCTAREYVNQTTAGLDRLNKAASINHTVAPQGQSQSGSSAAKQRNVQVQPKVTRVSVKARIAKADGPSKANSICKSKQAPIQAAR